MTYIHNPLQLSKVHYKSFNASLTSINYTDNIIILSNKRNLIVTPDQHSLGET